MPETLKGAARAITIEVPDIGSVSSLAIRPPRAFAALTLAHGAGAGMRHPFMEALAERLSDRGVATLRYQFPYLELGGHRPDPPAVATATVRAAAAHARDAFEDLPLFAGGKSYGGRMSSTAQAEEPISGIRGLVFFGFPLHPAGRPAITRASHLQAIRVPMLFLQGSRDALAEMSLLRPVCENLGSLATLHIFEDADHSFHLTRRSGGSDEQVLDGLASSAADWMRTAIAPRG
jgi:uncharacterized protein